MPAREMFVSLNGMVNQVVEGLGGDAIPFMQRPQWYRTIFVTSEVWQTVGWGTIGTGRRRGMHRRLLGVCGTWEYVQVGYAPTRPEECSGEGERKQLALQVHQHLLE